MSIYVHSLVPRPSCAPANIIRMIFFSVSTEKRDKKIIACVMLVGEREGLGTRLCIHAITSYLIKYFKSNLHHNKLVLICGEKSHMQCTL